MWLPEVEFWECGVGLCPVGIMAGNTEYAVVVLSNCRMECWLEGVRSRSLACVPYRCGEVEIESEEVVRGEIV